MKNKRITVGETEIESKNTPDVLDAGAAVSKLPNDLVYREHELRFVMWRYGFPLVTALVSLVGTLVSLGGISWVFSDLSQIPQAYAYLIAIIVSSIVGISVTFLLARLIDKKRRAETEEVIERVRFEESELFEMLGLDFDRIIRRRELDAGQTN